MPGPTDRYCKVLCRRSNIRSPTRTCRAFEVTCAIRFSKSVDNLARPSRSEKRTGNLASKICAVKLGDLLGGLGSCSTGNICALPSRVKRPSRLPVSSLWHNRLARYRPAIRRPLRKINFRGWAIHPGAARSRQTTPPGIATTNRAIAKSFISNNL